MYLIISCITTTRALFKHIESIVVCDFCFFSSHPLKLHLEGIQHR